jgi:hypothetical protein
MNRYALQRRVHQLREIEQMTPRMAATLLRALSRACTDDDTLTMVALASRALDDDTLDDRPGERRALELYRATYLAGRRVHHKSTADFPTDEEMES